MIAEDRREQFQYWLASMDEAIEAFIDFVPDDRRSAFDMTPQSLDALEYFILQEGAARYFGEVLRRGTGAKWAINTNDEKFVFYGLPILFGGLIAAVPVCPLTTITSCVDRRRGSYLRTIFENLAQKQAAAN